MKILAVDDCEIVLGFIHTSLEAEIPGVEVVEHKSDTLGKDVAARIPSAEVLCGMLSQVQAA